MPFAAPIQTDEEKKNQEGQSQNVSGVSGGFAGTNVPGQEAGSQKKQGSGKYTNIQQYLDANKQQAGQMGSQIAQNVEGQAQEAQQKVGALDTQAPKVEAYNVNEKIQQAPQMTDVEKQQYKTVKKTGGYTGPATVDQVSGYQEAQKASQKAAQNVANAGTESGQQELLKQQYNRPSYSAGQNRLDQVLLQNSADSRSQLENLSNKYSGIDKLFDTTTQKVGTAINEAQKQALANRQAFAGAEEQARKAFIDPLQKRAQETMLSNADLQKRVAADLQDEVLSQETMDLLGLNEGTRLFDTDLSKYLNVDQTQLGANDVATQEERQRYKMLADLFEDPTMNQITQDQVARKPVSINDQLALDIAAKQRAFDELAKQGKTASGSYKGSSGNTYADASGSLADYLAGIGPNVIATRGSEAYADVSDINRAKSKASRQYQALMDQLLNDQKYNRVIKKG